MKYTQRQLRYHTKKTQENPQETQNTKEAPNKHHQTPKIQ
jgi:hypothetical protein